MFNEFKNGSKVIVNGIGLKDGKFYKNVPAIIIERDPYYLDYHVKFQDGTTDWLSPEYLRKPYSKRKKEAKKNED